MQKKTMSMWDGRLRSVPRSPPRVRARSARPRVGAGLSLRWGSIEDGSSPSGRGSGKNETCAKRSPAQKPAKVRPNMAALPVRQLTSVGVRPLGHRHGNIFAGHETRHPPRVTSGTQIPTYGAFGGGQHKPAEATCQLSKEPDSGKSSRRGSSLIFHVFAALAEFSASSSRKTAARAWTPPAPQPAPESAPSDDRRAHPPCPRPDHPSRQQHSSIAWQPGVSNCTIYKFLPELTDGHRPAAARTRSRL